MPACPGATGSGYPTVFTAYQCLTFYHRVLTCQVWARGLGQGHQDTKAKYEFITLSEKEEDNVPRIKRVLKE